jgi:hypothetical protein
MMRKNRRLLGTLAHAIVLCLIVAAAAPAAADDDAQRYAVTVTNLTRGQIFSPPLAIVHDADYSVFVPGEAASPELAQLAEDAVAGPLMALLGTEPGVFDFDLGAGVVLPGESLTVEVDVRGGFTNISVLGMLVTTNDAFLFASGSVLPKGRTHTTLANAWDAGSEGNTESCEHIPGPPCGNPLVRVTNSAEGYVHVHAGIQGSGELAGADRDWNNPVAIVTVERIERRRASIGRAGNRRGPAGVDIGR